METASAETPFLDRSLRASAGIGLLTGLFLTVYAGPGFAGRYLLFLGWMLVNLLIWKTGIPEILVRRRIWVLMLLAMAKTVWLALLIPLGLWSGIEKMDAFTAFLFGFNTPLLVMSLKIAGRAMTRPRQGPDKDKKIRHSFENPS